MNLSAPFIRRPVMATILMVCLLIGGLIAFFKLPVTDLPNVDYPIIQVHASYSGASPEVMSRMVALPLEKELSNISGLKNMTSQSSRGMTWISLVFQLDQNIDKAAQEVQTAIQKAEAHLPKDLDNRPVFSKVNSHEESILYLALTSSSDSLSELYTYAHQRIQQRLARVDGVGAVRVYGSPYAVRIQLNPELLAARGLAFDEVRQSIGQATGNLPLGVLDTPSRKFSLEVPGSLKNAADFAKLQLAPDVQLKDVAQVFDSLESEEVFHFLTQDESRQAIIVAVQKKGGANVVNISKSIQKLLPDIQAELLPSMKLELWFDKANWIKQAIEDVEESLVLAFILVVVVIYSSLRRWRETLIAATALPLSVIGTFIVMKLLDFNIDLLSLLALTLAMGFVIDDAIVVLENIVRHQEKGLSRRQAALAGSKQIGFTVLSMTVSLIAVFLPFLFMQDITGRLFREFSVTMAVSILVSGFVSLAFTPMLCSRFLSRHIEQVKPKSLFFLSFYKRTLAWCLQHKKTTLSSGFVCLGLVVFCSRFVSVDLFPQEDRGFVWSWVQTPGGMSAKDAALYQKKLSTIVQNHPSVESAVAMNFKDFYTYLIRLHPTDKRSSQAVTVGELQEQFNSVPGTQAFMQGIQLITASTGGYTQNNYQFVLRGSDFEEVRLAGAALKQKLLVDSTFINPEINVKAEAPILYVKVLDNQATKVGLTRQAIQSVLQNAYAGGSVGKIEKGSEQYNVIVELDAQFQKNIEALSKLYVPTASGTKVPLKAVAEWEESVGLQNIEHREQLPSVVLYFDIAKDIPANKALERIKQIAGDTLPPSVTGKLEGMADMVDSTTGDTLFLLILAVVSMYVVLAILYESFIHPFTILSALPFACLGGVLTLLLFKEPLSLYSIVGFLLLIGIVKKNGIMMIDYALELQNKENRSALEAIQEACLVRFRPIMMTTIAAVVGAVPIAIGMGAGANTRRGLGLVIGGGLIFAQMLTLYITPILYVYLEKLRLQKKVQE